MVSEMTRAEVCFIPFHFTQCKQIKHKNINQGLQCIFVALNSHTVQTLAASLNKLQTFHTDLPYMRLIIRDKTCTFPSRYSDQATGWTIRGSNPDTTKKSFSSNRPKRQWGPSTHQFNVCRRSLSGVKQPGCEVDHSPPPGAEGMNGATPLPPPLKPSWPEQGQTLL